VRVSRAGLMATLAVIVVAGVCIRLGFWQLERLEQRREVNAHLRVAMAEAPLALDAATAAGVRRHPEEFRYRRATARGVYEFAGEMLLRGRSHDGRPGVHVVTPLRLRDDGAVILVNRGWIPSADAATADPRPYRPGGVQTIEGMLQAVPDAPGEAAPVRIDLGETSLPTYRRLDRSTLATALGEPILPLYLEELPSARGNSRIPLPVPPPALDDGPHLGYAIQWFSFAAIAVAGYLVILRRGTSAGAARR
jgi:surfeit locus 1 family protein